MVSNSIGYRWNEPRIIQSLSRMGIDDPERALRSYPHQLSVGMLQRMMIAIATMGEPELLLADEPTSAVDATMRCQILDLLTHKCRENGTTLIFTTHDLGIARAYADTVMVLYGGRIVEHARSDQFFSRSTAFVLTIAPWKHSGARQFS